MSEGIRKQHHEPGVSISSARKPFFLLTTHHSLLTSTAQSAIEYAVLVAVMVAALISMAVYTKRALSGKWREVGDRFGHGRQYEPGRTVVQ